METRHFFRSFQSSVIIVIALLTVISCKRFPEPDFSYTPTDNLEAGDAIQFTNGSADANTYEWEFGDGGTSSQENPMYTYAEAGIYDVKLTAFNEAGGQAKTKSLIINEPTVLGFFVSDSTGKIALSDAEVWVYDNESDWENLNEPQITGITDSEGIVVFTNVEPIVFYIWAVKQETGGTWISGGYTPALEQNEINMFNVPCTWVENQKKATFSIKRHPLELTGAGH
ncbi:MAG: PKD domain-containing protein [Bacteroidales bacterium]|nr:PKD domain-containing protein [Bacteroidales bacterium]